MRRSNTIALSIVGTSMLLGGGAAADNIMNPYTDLTMVRNGKQIDVFSEEKASSLPESGNAQAIMQKDSPRVEFDKWNGEVKMGVTYTGIPANTPGNRPLLSKNVEWKHGNETLQVVPVSPSAEIEDGGYEINVILDAKPASNVFTFDIDGWEDLDFFYQPELTEEEIADGASRPENVVGSYAVYYKNHSNHVVGQTNYATGKAYHIFRPKVIDNDGVETWAELAYDNGVLTVTVPQSFLDTAAYPVTVDPTFGNTVCGATNSTMKDFINGLLANLPSSSVDVSSISICVAVDTAAHNSVAGIYDTSGPSKVTNGNSSQISIPTSANGTFVDYTFTTNPTLNSGNYWLVANCGNTAGTCSQKSDATGGASVGFQSSAYSSTLPASLSLTTQTNNRSIYATYTTSGGNGSTAPKATINGAVINGAQI